MRGTGRTLRFCLIATLLGTAAGGSAMLLSTDAAMAQSGSKPWLGVEVSSRKDGKSGVLAKHVVRTSPADTAGLRDGDGILKVGGKAVSQPPEVIAEVRARKPGEALEVVFERGGSEKTARVTLGIFPGADELLRRDRVGTFAPSLSGVQSVQGTVPAALGSLKGRVVLLDFWAGWCGVCRLTTPILNDWHDRLSAQGLTVIGLSSDTAQVATKATSEFGIKYPVAVDKGETVFPAYGVTSLPTMFVIDKKGVVREVEVGFDAGSQRRIEALVHKLLAEKAD